LNLCGEVSGRLDRVPQRQTHVKPTCVALSTASRQGERTWTHPDSAVEGLLLLPDRVDVPLLLLDLGVSVRSVVRGSEYSRMIAIRTWPCPPGPQSCQSSRRWERIRMRPTREERPPRTRSPSPERGRTAQSRREGCPRERHGRRRGS
jgi:hypothetical protein